VKASKPRVWKAWAVVCESFGHIPHYAIHEYRMEVFDKRAMARNAERAGYRVVPVEIREIPRKSNGRAK
jgi:hypothetical protein